jgi:hypothetical protein
MQSTDKSQELYNVKIYQIPKCYIFPYQSGDQMLNLSQMHTLDKFSVW